MILTKIRLQEEHPTTSIPGFIGDPIKTWSLPTIDLDLTVAAGKNGYILKDTVGLDPPDFTSIVVGFDATGIPIMDTALAKREIVLKVALSPNLGQSTSQLRDQLYKLVNRSLHIQLMNEQAVTAQTTGFVRNCDSRNFTNQPEVIITIECTDSWFSAPAPIDIPIVDIDKLHPVINYSVGTAPTGIELVIDVDVNTSGFIILDHAKHWFAGEGPVDNFFEVDYDFLAGDIITLTTQTKNQRLTLLRGITEHDLAGYVNAGAVWPQLIAGVNAWEWSFYGSWMTWISARYTPRYWGV